MSRANPLARITPAQNGDARAMLSGALRLTRRQKAAIVVRFLLNEGADIPLTDLPEPLQEALTTQMGTMRYVDRQTLADVVAEFARELEALGLTFPRGVAGALSALDGRISPQTAARLRKEAGVRQFGDPWQQISVADTALLLPILQTESAEIASVLLSKLDVARAAELLGQLPGSVARSIAFEMSRTGSVSPDAVDRIGLAIAAQLHDQPEIAFKEGPVQRVGAILNYSPSATRDDVLTGLDETDREFASLVRKAMFTFVHIPERLTPVDVPKVVRVVDATTLATALAYAPDADLAEVRDFLLENMPGRLSDSIKEEIEGLEKVKPKDGERALTDVVNAIRQLEAAGELVLKVPDEEEPTE